MKLFFLIDVKKVIPNVWILVFSESFKTINSSTKLIFFFAKIFDRLYKITYGYKVKTKFIQSYYRLKLYLSKFFQTKTQTKYPC